MRKYTNPELVREWQDEQWAKRDRKQRVSIAVRRMWRENLVYFPDHMTILGCYYDDFKWHLRRQLVSCRIANIPVSWESPEWVIDHIIPISSFDRMSKDALRECWHWTNLRPLTTRENLKKSAKIQHSWHVPFSVRQTWSVFETFIGEEGLTHSNDETKKGATA